MELNLTNLKDLEYICQAAARQFHLGLEPTWVKRALRYQAMFRERITQLESEDDQ